MNTLTLELTDEQLELLDEMSRYENLATGQSEEMEELGIQIRAAIEELE